MDMMRLTLSNQNRAQLLQDPVVRSPIDVAALRTCCQQVVGLAAAAAPVLADGLLQVCCCDVAGEGTATP
jgi:hypothetical protein